jgi:hypothetical protein
MKDLEGFHEPIRSTRESSSATGRSSKRCIAKAGVTARPSTLSCRTSTRPGRTTEPMAKALDALIHF